MSIYLDYNAACPIDMSLIKELGRFSGNTYNPSSIHQYGRHARKIIDNARAQILGSLNAKNSAYRVVFGASGTEINNMVINGLNRKILLSPIEHVSVLNPAARRGNYEYLTVNDQGQVDLADLEEKLSKAQERVLISFIFANNETGVVQDMDAILLLARKYGAFVHSDCVQAYGKIKLDLTALDLDLVTISSHKIGGLPGAAALIFKKNIPLDSLIIGGGQELGFRAGTENVPAIFGFGYIAAKISEIIEGFSKTAVMRDLMEKEILAFSPDTKIFSKDSSRLANTSCFTMPGISSESQLIGFDLKNIAISNGAACSSGKVAVSHVLLALGTSKKNAGSAIRVSLGPDSNFYEIEEFLSIWKDIYNKTCLMKKVV